jgi:hypothetical protein
VELLNRFEAAIKEARIAVKEPEAKEIHVKEP